MHEQSGDSNPSTAAKTSSLSTQTVGLGFGSLMIIAFLILIFGRTNTGPLEDRIQDLQTEVQTLSKHISELRTILESRHESSSDAEVP